MDFLDLVFPRSCLNCGWTGSYICDNCLSKVRLANSSCPYCDKYSIGGATHTQCRQKYGLDGLISVWEYQGVIRKAILALKYKYSLLVGEELTTNFIKILKPQNLKLLNPTLIPIPLYWYRKNFRGFNQSEEIGKLVSKELGFKFILDLLIKNKSTPSQVELKGDARSQNIIDAFSLNSKFSSLDPNYIIFDDVFTTGSTVKEAAKVLKQSGAQRVWGLTIAR